MFLGRARGGRAGSVRPPGAGIPPRPSRSLSPICHCLSNGRFCSVRRFRFQEVRRKAATPDGTEAQQFHAERPAAHFAADGALKGRERRLHTPGPARIFRQPSARPAKTGHHRTRIRNQAPPPRSYPQQEQSDLPQCPRYRPYLQVRETGPCSGQHCGPRRLPWMGNGTTALCRPLSRRKWILRGADRCVFQIPDGRPASARRHDAAFKNKNRIPRTVLRAPKTICRAMGTRFGHQAQTIA